MMKRLIAIAVALLAAIGLSAADYTVTLKNDTKVKVQACTDAIFRVRISAEGSFPETLSERYGILKTDWGEVAASVSENDAVWTLSTATHKLSVDKANGSVSVCKADGSPVVKAIDYHPGNALCKSLSEVIIDKFGSMVVAKNDGIIGDDDNKGADKDRTESGDPAESNVLSITMEKGERFYGGGSTSREHIQHRGELLRMWCTYQHTEIPMPFMISSRGWGIYNNTTRKNHFDIGYTDPDRFNIYTTFPDADYYLFLEETMPAVISDYTLLTGRTYLLPKWAYGLCFGPNMREDQWAILNDAVLFRQMDVPVDLFWLEPQWMEKRYDFSTAKKFNSQLFSVEPYWLENKPDKKFYNRLFIGKLRNMGYHLGLWLCEEYDFTIQEEDRIAEREGRPQSGQEHWMDHLTKFMDLGVEGFKLDPARTIDEHANWKYHNGSTDKEMHNLNQVLLPKQMAELGKRYNGKRTWHHYCGGWSGTQHWTASTSGDNGGGKVALFDQLNLGMSGFYNTSCDVMSVPAELEMPSLHFGLFLPWVQINSWFSMMHPFYYNEKEQTIYRNYVQTRYELIPYIYSMAVESSQNGMPAVRSMPLVFPDDRNVDDMYYQYMFGDLFCVGIFTNDIYLPAGTWTDAWTGKKVVSKGETFTMDYPADRAGLLFIREGAIIPCMEKKDYIGNEPLDTYILKVYPHGESSYTLYDCDAEDYGYEKGEIARTTFSCRQSGKAVDFTIGKTEGSFRNMPESKTYKVRMHLDGKPGKVSVGGRKLEDWKYEDGVLSFDLTGVKDAVTVNVR